MTELQYILKWAGIWLFVSAVAQWLSALAYPLLRLILGQLSPALRGAARFGYVVMAPVSAIVVVVLLNWPGLLEPILAGHCHDSDCTAHSPLHSNTTRLVSLAVLSGLGVLLASGLLSWTLHISARRLRVLDKLSHSEGRLGSVRIVDTPGLLASCIGLFRPTVFVSRSLLKALSSRELEAVIAHEYQHAYRLDNLRALCARWSTLLWPAPMAGWVRRELALDAELACDQFAAAHSEPEALRSALKKMLVAPDAGERERLRYSEMWSATVAPQRLRKSLLHLAMFAVLVAMVSLLLNGAHRAIESLALLI